MSYSKNGRKAFDAGEPYTASVEVVRKAVLAAVIEAGPNLDPRLSSQEHIGAGMHGVAMAFVCVLLSTARPGQEKQLLSAMINELPKMMEDARTIRPGGRA